MINAITDIETLRTVALQAVQSLHGNTADLERYKERCRELESKLILKDERIAELLHERWCRSSEKLKGQDKNSQQIDLFNEIETTIADDNDVTDAVPVKSYNRKRGKRAKLPGELPRIETIIDIDETEKTCGCGAQFVRIGEDTSEKLEVIPTRFIVRKTVRPRYACPCCGGTENEPERAVAVAPMPPSLLPKTNASPSLLATIATWKFQDALPLYRQETIFARHGIELGRATMSRWMLSLYERCKPVVEQIEKHIRSGPMIGMDETPTQVHREEHREDTTVSYMWLARGGPPEKLAVRFMYHPTRSAQVPKEFLCGYKGILQTDGYETYDSALRALHAEGNDKIVHVGCMAHARRMFIKADRSGKIQTSAKVALAYIKKLYAIEKEATEACLDETSRFSLRQSKSVPLLIEFKSWLDTRKTEVPPESLIGKAIGYTLGQWEKLIRYCDYGFVPVDNNALENAVRPFVIGRKNYLFHGSPTGADASAAIYSIIETAKVNGHEPFFYLYFLFSKLPFIKTNTEIADLLPFNVSRKDVHSFAIENWLALGS